MSDDKSKADGQDRLRINAQEDFEVRDRARKFGVTKEELLAAVKIAGPMAKDVEALSKSRR